MFVRFAAATAIVTLAFSPAFAQAPAEKTGAKTVTTADPNAKESDVAKAAKTSLADAIKAAEAKDGQGRAIDADFEVAASEMPARWEIKVVYPDGKLVEHFVNADTGAIIKSENQPFERYFTRLKVEDFQKATTALKDALAIAETKVGGGKAYEAEVEREGDTVVYEISVAGANGSQDVKVGHDGKVVGD